MSRFAVSLISLLLALAAPAMTFAQAGIGSGRATEADIARLASDLNYVAIAENRVKAASERQLMIDRQKQLLGEQSSLSGEQLLEQTKQWWRKHLFDPLQDIARNPAASCNIAQQLIQRILTVERQSQFFGLEGEEFATGGELFTEALALINRRCVEEAFDECMMTGNGMALMQLLASSQRQGELLGLEDPEFKAQVAYLFRRCTVYKVKFHADTTTTSYYKYRSVVEGSRILLFQFGPGEASLDQIRNGEWRGPIPAEVGAPDVMLIEQSCSSLMPQLTITCGPALRPYPPQAAYQNARAVFTLKRNFDELVMGSRGALQIVKRQEGDNTMWLTFTPLGVQLELKIVGPVGQTVKVETFNTLVGFTIAYGSPRTPEEFKIKDWQRQGYPVLFSKEISGTKSMGITVSDKTRFELIHRPDLYPPDQIDPKYELGLRQEKPEKIRTPAKHES